MRAPVAGESRCPLSSTRTKCQSAHVHMHTHAQTPAHRHKRAVRGSSAAGRNSEKLWKALPLEDPYMHCRVVAYVQDRLEAGHAWLILVYELLRGCAHACGKRSPTALHNGARQVNCSANSSA